MSDYLDDELASRARTRLDRHLGQCEDCRRLLARMRLMLDALHHLPAPTGGVDARQTAAAVRARLGEPSSS